MRVRYSRVHPFYQLRGEMDRLFNDVFAPAVADGWERLSGSRVFPAVNLWEEEQSLFVEAELPGVKAEDLDIAVVGNELTLSGRRVEPEQQEGLTFHRRERGYGEFTRHVTLPVDVDSDRVQAQLTDGVLRIELPKAEKARPRKIQVTATSPTLDAPSQGSQL